MSHDTFHCCGLWVEMVGGTAAKQLPLRYPSWSVVLRKFSLQLRQHGAMHISSQCPCQRKECLREQGNIHVWHEFDLCCRFCWPPRPRLGGWWHSCKATSFEISFLVGRFTEVFAAATPTWRHAHILTVPLSEKRVSARAREHSYILY